MPNIQLITYYEAQWPSGEGYGSGLILFVSSNSLKSCFNSICERKTEGRIVNCLALSIFATDIRVKLVCCLIGVVELKSGTYICHYFVIIMEDK